MDKPESLHSYAKDVPAGPAPTITISYSKTDRLQRK